MKNLFVMALAMAVSSLFAAMPERGVCAHRGNDGKMPENTTLAWPNAVKLGAQMVELDVKRCKTGELVIMHDATVDRTTNGKGYVTNLTFSAIRELEANYRKGKPIPGCPSVKVPTFEEAIDSIPADAEVWINCHCAPNTAVEVAKIIKAKGRLKQAFIAMSLKAIAQARKVVPEILTCNMSRTFTGVQAYHKPWPPEKSTLYAKQTVENKCQFLQLLAPCSKDDIKMMHDAGVKVSYFHCENPEKVKALVDLGVDFILTDNLVAIRDKMKELSK
ncbi:MAG: glycerophosphodiester phosphodiesterase family protein [bacterium]|nr:glycerophosphodiester phosphodiesterase family protein [bacterium]